MRGLMLVSMLVVSTAVAREALPEDRLSHDEAARALRRAVQFFRKEVSASGGYLWQYSADLSRREGEGRAEETTAWVQPPGTPSVGSAFLDAYMLTNDSYYLEAARETARALAAGQLRSGGWDYRIEFDPRNRKRHAYRTDDPIAKQRNVTTLDDDTTQSALRFLMRVDRAVKSSDKPIHEAVMFALDSLLKAQYPNGAWPQRYSEFPDAKQYPVKRASYPRTWSRTHSRANYNDYYTFNDNTLADMITTMLEAADVYGDKRYRSTAEKAGDFILLAQMPEPQPAWAQQYDASMHPAWARRFEPPAITGGESRGVIRILLQLYRATGREKYLQPIPRALAYLKKSRLPDGRFARFYELKTNKPLFFTKKYELTYRSDDLPTHYGFILSWDIDALENEYERLRKTDPSKLRPAKSTEPRPARLTRSLQQQAAKVVRALDTRGAWVEPGRLKRFGENDPTTRVITSRTFVNNVRTLARYVSAEAK